MNLTINQPVWYTKAKKKAIVKAINGSKVIITYFNKDDVRTKAEVDSKELKEYKSKTDTVDEKTLYFAKVNPDAIIPSKRQEDGCYDIYACHDEPIVIRPHEIAEVKTGIATAFSSKYRLDFQRERGSTGAIGLVPRCGQDDSGYRGEVFLRLQNTNANKTIIIDPKATKVISHEDFIVYPMSKAVCQAALEIVPDVEIKEIPYSVLEQIPSQRGKTKLGQSGK